jgi:energy-coupling factor transporter ATP-binding protein EcfA2
LANDPAIVVADEPTGNLDSRTADAVFHLFETLVSEGKTILMVTHDATLAQRASRAVTITDGEIAADTRRLATEAFSVPFPTTVHMNGAQAPSVLQGSAADLRAEATLQTEPVA